MTLYMAVTPDKYELPMLIAESKAEIALQYTVAVRDKLIDAYKELMQMSV